MGMSVLTGLDIIQKDQFKSLQGKQIAVLCNQATINCHFLHILELLLPYHQQKFLEIKAIFGPQHGLWGHTQDNMIEWEGFHDGRSGLKIFSLYGQNRKPTRTMLEGVEIMLIDLPDIGSRYYTFIWSMALTMEACQENKINVLVLDRPNPINGSQVEGTVLDPFYQSFVGLYPLPQRHGMTLGEIALYLQDQFLPTVKLKVIRTKKWKRAYYFPQTQLPWVMPSPNMPFWETALVYPGMCLLEGTELSEGRGTTRPFETFGAPWIDGRRLCQELNAKNLPGVFFRPVQFLPTFQKFRDELCEGAFIHVTDKEIFKPVLTALWLLQTISRIYPNQFSWKNPPYEYEYQKIPFDILAGNEWLRQMIEQQASLETIQQRMEKEIEIFNPLRQKYLLY
jgi:uncharacterized protein YbbC (DUF1343 family)